MSNLIIIFKKFISKYNPKNKQYYNIWQQTLNQRLWEINLHSLIYVEINSILVNLNLHHLEMFIIIWFQFSPSIYFYKIYKLFLRSDTSENFPGSLLREDFTRNKRFYGVLFVKVHKCFLFDHKEFLVISLVFWVKFSYDWIYGYTFVFKIMF